VEGSLKEIKDHSSQQDPNKQIKREDTTSFTARSRLDADQSVFKVYKGVKTFAFSKIKNVIVTGGLWYSNIHKHHQWASIFSTSNLKGSLFLNAGHPVDLYHHLAIYR